jgi:hypothetical protein
MAKTRDDIERDLEARGRSFEVLDEHTIAVPLVAGQAPAVLRFEPPVVLMQVNIGNAEFTSDAKAVAFYRRLLELNASDLLHASYGLEGNRVVLSAALALDNLDSNELEATLSDLALALVEQLPSLHHLAAAEIEGQS